MKLDGWTWLSLHNETQPAELLSCLCHCVTFFTRLAVSTSHHRGSNTRVHKWWEQMGAFTSLWWVFSQTVRLFVRNRHDIWVTSPCMVSSLCSVAHHDVSISLFFFLTVLLCFAVSEFSRKSTYKTNIKSPILLDKVSILVYTSSVNAGEEWKHLQASLQENMVLQRFCANVMRAMMSVKDSNLITHLPHTPHWIRIISNFILQKFFGIWWVILDCCQNCRNCPLLVLDLVGLFSATDPTKLQKPS